MPDNIFPQMPPPPPQKRVKVSWLAIVFIVILTIVLIVLGERFLVDLNRWFNPTYTSGSSYYLPVTQRYNEGSYESYRLFIHAAFIIPVFLAAFLLFFWLYYKKERTHKSIIAWPYFIFAIWMTLHLVIEAFIFLISQYKEAGFYIVMIILAALLTWLVLFVQRRLHEKK
jgi:ABC-type xylose transport system permease subunit